MGPNDSTPPRSVNGELGFAFPARFPTFGRSMCFPLETDVATAAQLLRAGTAVMIDVREPHELAVCRVPGSVHLPMREIPARFAEIPADRQVLVLCHHGGRSARVTQFLRANGRDNATNVAGGIHAWAQQVDPTLARY